MENWKRKGSDGSHSTKEDGESDEELNLSYDWSTWSSTIYSRESDDSTNLDDFDILNNLGIGSFGKVFLVQHKRKKDLYAMKTIWKDKIIEYE